MDNPDLKTKANRFQKTTHSLIESFRFAASGVAFTLVTQRNMKLHVLAALAVLLLGLVLPFDPTSKAVILLCIGLVLFSEIMNTAMEAIVDLYTGETHRLAKTAKDAAAGGVMVLSLSAVFIFLWLVEEHYADILRVEMLLEKSALVLSIVLIESAIVFLRMRIALLLFLQVLSLSLMIMMAILAYEPIFSTGAFLLVVLIFTAPLIVAKNESS